MSAMAGLAHAQGRLHLTIEGVRQECTLTNRACARLLYLTLNTKSRGKMGPTDPLPCDSRRAAQTTAWCNRFVLRLMGADPFASGLLVRPPARMLALLPHMSSTPFLRCLTAVPRPRSGRCRQLAPPRGFRSTAGSCPAFSRRPRCRTAIVRGRASDRRAHAALHGPMLCALSARPTADTPCCPTTESAGRSWTPFWPPALVCNAGGVCGSVGRSLNVQCILCIMYARIHDKC